MSMSAGLNLIIINGHLNDMSLTRQKSLIFIILFLLSLSLSLSLTLSLLPLLYDYYLHNTFEVLNSGLPKKCFKCHF